MKDGAEPLLEDALEALRGPTPSSPTRSRRRWRRSLAERELKPGKLYQPIRVAITGGRSRPGIFESLAVLGKERSLARIERALDVYCDEAQHKG